MSRASFLVIALWFTLCAIAIFLRAFTINTEQAAFYTIYYVSFMLIITSASAAVLCYRTMASCDLKDKNRKGWQFLSIGLGFWSLGAILESIYLISHQVIMVPFPWYADMSFLLLEPFVVIALFIFRKNWNIPMPLNSWIMTIITFFCALSLGIWINAKGFQTIEPISLIVTIAYIILDSILLAMTVATASILAGGLIARPWWFALAGLFIFYLGNMTYTLVRNVDKILINGIILELAWPIAFGLIAIAATTAHTIYKEFD